MISVSETGTGMVGNGIWDANNTVMDHININDN